eukprot:COSAG02_NODE_4534_length_5245_cov_13.164594_2_plen_70_part_00
MEEIPYRTDLKKSPEETFSDVSYRHFGRRSAAGVCTGQDIYHQAEKLGSAHLVHVRAWHPEGKDVRLYV